MSKESTSSELSSSWGEDAQPQQNLGEAPEHEMTVLRRKNPELEGVPLSASISQYNDNRIEIEEAIQEIGSGIFQRRILIAAGLCFAADSMEVLLLSFLSVVLQAQWDLTDEQTSTITSSVFIGALIGTLVLGKLGDYWGRKPVFSLTAAIITVFGFLTAMANSFEALLLYRFAVGFGVGGLTVPFDTLAEFLPISQRGTNLLVIEYFWTMGTLLVPTIAYFTLGEGENYVTDESWRYFVAFCAIPCLFSTLLGMVFVPESPRWLLMQGKSEEALSILRMAALTNSKDPRRLFPPGTVVYAAEEEGCSSFLDLFRPEWRVLTFLLWGTWAGFAFTYYGTIIIVTMVFSETTDEKGDDESSGGVYSFDYAAIFASASSEIAGTSLAIYLVERVGRICTQFGSYVGGGCSVFMLCMLAAWKGPRSLMIASAFLSRMFFMGGSCSTWVSTAELLPTPIRTTGHSTANAVARLSGSFSPYIVSNATPLSVIGPIMLLISFLSSFLVRKLPETKGKRMGDTHGDGLVKIPTNDETETVVRSSVVT